MSKILRLSISFAFATGVFLGVLTVAHADCDSFYQAALFGRTVNKNDKVEVAGQAVTGTAAVATTADAVATGVGTTSVLTGAAGAASVAVVGFVYYDLAFRN